jgi:PAS domain S-box-containing protein
MTESQLIPMKLLVIEDSDDDEFLLLRHLKKGGYKVTHTRVETREEMERALQDTSWDIIISDYSLPTFSGLQALEVYTEQNCDLPFIIVSGTIGEETAVRALQSGAHDFVLKGKYARLLPAIDRELREFRTRQARREAEARLKANELRFRSLIEKALDIITVIDKDGAILYASPAVETVLGYTSEEITGRRVVDLIHPEDRQMFQDLLDDTLTHPLATHHSMVRCKHASGENRVLESVGRNLLDDPTVGGIVINSRDVTDRHKAEHALRQANARLQSALAELKDSQSQAIQQERLIALGSMASGIAHDFNNALTSVLGFSEALLMYPDLLDDKEQTLELIQMMNTAAQDGAGVVSRLSEFYRHREKDEEFLPLDLAAVAEETLRLTKPKWSGQAQAAGVQIETEMKFDAVPTILGNRQELRQALTNLIFNAVDAMPDGGTLSLTTHSEGDHVILELSDTGTGMTEETKTRCLEPFFTTKGRKGTGMGLSMVYGIIRRHQGIVEIDSQLGQGTTFRLSFPTELSEDTGEGEVSAEHVDLSARSLTTLVVESEPMIMKVISTFLLCDGHRVKAATTGAQGLEIFRREGVHVDLVVTAEALPDLSGPQIAQRILEECPNTPVILLTSFGEERGELPGVNKTLAKPFTLSAFRAAVREACHEEP